MLPEIGQIDNWNLDADESTNSNVHTFGINIKENIIGGKINDLDALRQSLYLMFSIEADQYIIYPYTYGLKTLDLIGKPYYYVMAVLPKRIESTALSDSRVTGVSDFEFERNKNTLGVKFTVHTIYGNTQVETEVAY